MLNKSMLLIYFSRIDAAILDGDWQCRNFSRDPRGEPRMDLPSQGYGKVGANKHEFQKDLIMKGLTGAGGFGTANRGRGGERGRGRAHNKKA